MTAIDDIPDLRTVRPLEGYKLELTYSNGYVGIFDLNELFNYEVFNP